MFAIAAVTAVVTGVCYWAIEISSDDADWPDDPHPHQWALLVTMSLCMVAAPVFLLGGIVLCVL